MLILWKENLKLKLNLGYDTRKYVIFHKIFWVEMLS